MTEDANAAPDWYPGNGEQAIVCPFDSKAPAAPATSTPSEKTASGTRLAGLTPEAPSRRHFTLSRAVEYCLPRELEAQTGQPIGNFARLVAPKELLDNSLDAAEAASRLSVVAIAADFDAAAESLALIVRDNGDGIAPDVVSRPMSALTFSATSATHPPTSQAHPGPQSTRAEWAAYWAGLGVALTIIPPGAKKPHPDLKDWPNRPIDPSHWANHPQDGIGALLGKSGLCSLDADDTEGTRLALAAVGLNVEELKAGAVVIQGNPARWRAMFRLPPGISPSRKALAWPEPSGELDARGHPKQITIFELRAGACQDVLPPSIHPGTNQSYRLLVAPWDLEAWAELPPALVELWHDWDHQRRALEAACPWVPQPDPKPTEPSPRLAPPAGGESVIESFNAAHDPAAILEAHGYKPAGPNRWLSPHSTSGEPGIHRLSDTGRIYSHHASDPLSGPPHDAFSLYTVLGHQGDTRQAIKSAARLLGLDYRPRGEDPTQAGAAGPEGVSGQAGGAAPLTGPEVDRLLAWAAHAGATLPDADAVGIFTGPPDPRTGKAPERLRVNVREGTDFSAPWRSLLWTHGRAGFMEAVNGYLPKRAALVERKLAERMAKGETPQADLAEEDLRDHAEQWLAGIRTLDVAEEEGRALLARLPATAPDRIQPPPAASLIPTEAELAAARLSPRCIVRHHTYADVAGLVAPGGVGKTTLLIHEAVHIALGRAVWGLPVEAPGWTLFVTAEDRREQFMARLREILACLPLGPADRARALRGVRVWDVTGEAIKLIKAQDGNVVLTDLADAIVDSYQADPPAVVIFDPLVSFGASEGMVNDNEQGIILAARRIVKGLDCCVRVVHHTGKGPALTGALDQYAGRGGSALADGTRMLSVLQTWTTDAPGNRHPPPGCQPGPGVSITLLARAKLSYAPPDLPLLWVRRDRFAYEAFTEEPKPAPEARRAVEVEQVERFILAELVLERRYTPTTLETKAEALGLTRQAIRNALAELRIAGRVGDRPLPKALCQGSRKTYLAPLPNPAEDDGRVVPGEAPEDDPTPPPTTTPPPYRDSTPGGVVPGGTNPHPDNPAANDWQGSAELAECTASKVIDEVLI
jgi:hypothetical protein